MKSKLKLETLIGKKFNNLSIIEIIGRNKKSHIIVKCKCNCGKIKKVSYSNLKFNSVQSCGCSTYKIQNLNKLWKGYGKISGTYFNIIKYNANQRKIPFRITIKQIWNLFEKQKGICALSGIKLKFDTLSGKYDGNASLDRIDSSKGYLKNNIQWIHKDINKMKMDLSEKIFWNYIKALYINKYA